MAAFSFPWPMEFPLMPPARRWRRCGHSSAFMWSAWASLGRFTPGRVRCCMLQSEKSPVDRRLRPPPEKPLVQNRGGAAMYGSAAFLCIKNLQAADTRPKKYYLTLVKAFMHHAYLQCIKSKIGLTKVGFHGPFS